MVGPGIASIFDIEVPEDFKIYRGSRRYKDTQIARAINIKNALSSGAINRAKKMIGVFRNENPDFEHEINIALLYLDRGDNQKAVDIVDTIRQVLFKNFVGNTIIERRMMNASHSRDNVGQLYNLPSDVVCTIAEINRN